MKSAIQQRFEKETNRVKNTIQERNEYLKDYCQWLESLILSERAEVRPRYFELLRKYEAEKERADKIETDKNIAAEIIAIQGKKIKLLESVARASG